MLSGAQSADHCDITNYSPAPTLHELLVSILPTLVDVSSN